MKDKAFTIMYFIFIAICIGITVKHNNLEATALGFTTLIWYLAAMIMYNTPPTYKDKIVSKIKEVSELEKENEFYVRDLLRRNKREIVRISLNEIYLIKADKTIRFHLDLNNLFNFLNYSILEFNRTGTHQYKVLEKE